MYRGWHSESGTLQVEYNGCTPAFAGKEVNKLKDMIYDGMCREEVAKIKKVNPIEPPSHDLLASCLTIFAGVFGNWQSDSNHMMVWQKGGAGLEVLEAYWGK